MRNGSKYHAVILFKNTGRRQSGGGGGRGGINKYERNNFRAKFCQCSADILDLTKLQLYAMLDAYFK